MTRNLITQIEEILTHNEAIKEFCLDAYGRLPTLYTFVDEDNPAPESDYPVIAITALDRMSGGYAPTVSYHLEIGCGVINETIETPGNIRRHVGMIETYELISLVENALVAARKFAKVEFHGQTNAVQWFPKYISVTTATITRVVGRR